MQIVKSAGIVPSPRKHCHSEPINRHSADITREESASKIVIPIPDAFRTTSLSSRAARYVSVVTLPKAKDLCTV